MHEKMIISPDTERKNRIPPHQHVTDRWPVLHHGGVPAINTAEWAFTIKGLVEPERVLTYAEFAALPRVRIFSDIHCVTHWSKLNNIWEGVSTSVIRELANIRPQAKYVMVHASAGFTTNLPMSDFFQPDVLFAFSHDGEPLSETHGYPLRLVVPRLYFWKSAKWTVGVEFMEKDRKGFWEAAGYHMHGDPWKEERYGD